MNDLRDREFEEIANSVHHWERMRWVSMTIFMAVMAVAITGSFSTGQGSIGIPKVVLYLGGLLFCIIFWIQDERIVVYWKAFIQLAREFEDEHEICVFSRMPPRPFISSGTAVRTLYFSFTAFWAVNSVMALQSLVAQP